MKPLESPKADESNIDPSDIEMPPTQPIDITHLLNLPQNPK
ncbi:MAG: hypothetical protein WED09_08490 [Homoserinimonas sp.]